MKYSHAGTFAIVVGLVGVACGSSDGGTASSAGGSAGIGGSNGGMGNVAGDSATIGGESSAAGASAVGGSVAAGGNAATGGAIATGGANGVGGATGGAKSAGGATSTGANQATGGNGATGGAANTGGSKSTGGAASTGGSKSTGGSAATGGGSSTGSLFSQCRFHFGTIDTIAKRTTNNPSMSAQLDFFTPGWMLGNFAGSGVCSESASGGALAGLVPVVVGYIAANYVKSQHGLCDCNVTTCGSSGGKVNDLCNYGAQYITQDWAAILSQYTSNSTGYAACLGGRPIIFEMEPDWYQYTITGQSQPWTAATAGTNMTALVNALKASLPNARFSMDISPWIATNGSAWYPNFNMGLFTFINTSGGGTDANNTRIRANNTMTWAGVNTVTGKPILADTGYGAAGASAGEDPNWNVAANINARIADGVVSISQYNPTTGWGGTIANIRSQLNAPRYCP
jgi:hypothetical protein